jgi:hypothetical protein
VYPGWLISVLVLLPNLFWIIFPPRGAPAEERAERGRLYRLMEVLEWIGRIGSFVIPCFYRVEVPTGWQRAALVVMVLALLLYYAGWARYFLRGRDYRLLFEPFLGVPLPLAIGPIVYFLAAALLLRSWYMAAAALILAIGHLYISYHSLQALGDGEPAF